MALLLIHWHLSQPQKGNGYLKDTTPSVQIRWQVHSRGQRIRTSQWEISEAVTLRIVCSNNHTSANKHAYQQSLHVCLPGEFIMLNNSLRGNDMILIWILRSQRKAAVAFLFSSASILYALTKSTHRVPAAATAGTGAQGTYQIPSFALGGCERSGMTPSISASSSRPPSGFCWIYIRSGCGNFEIRLFSDAESSFTYQAACEVGCGVVGV